MVDQAKRKTLKNVAGIGAGTIAAAVSPAALSQLTNSQKLNGSDAISVNEGLVEIQVSTRISPTANELEVVLTNTGSVPATITDMTPAEINTARGKFDFQALIEAGDLHLAEGESVSVPMQHHPVVLDGSALGRRTVQLNQALRRNVSIITDGNSLAAVTHKNQTSFA